jgi:hypothetical protein
MSDSHDVADHEDMAAFHGKGTVIVREMCESCGRRFDAEAREAGTDGSGRPVQELVSPDCPACVELGAKPPPCPCCGGKLIGQPGSTSELFVVPWFACEETDGGFPVDSIRTYVFGRAMEALLREHGDAAGSARRATTFKLILRKARELHVIL